MPRKRRPLNREIAHRDARLIIIATEDSEASVKYFEEFASARYYQNSKAQVIPLRRSNTNSSPEQTLALLDTFCAEYQFDPDRDELWLLIDVDRWGNKKLSEIATKCLQKGFKLAVSNPAIEVWFLLHVASCDEYTPEIQEKLFANERPTLKSSRTWLEKAIVDKVGAFNKGNLNADDFLPYVAIAIKRAEALDVVPQDRWPQTFGTRVHLLAMSILKSSPYHRHLVE